MGEAYDRWLKQDRTARIKEQLSAAIADHRDRKRLKAHYKKRAFPKLEKTTMGYTRWELWGREYQAAHRALKEAEQRVKFLRIVLQEAG